MAEVFWTPRATRSLSEISAYLGEDNPVVADRTIRGILQKADMLRRLPQLGPPLVHRNRQGLRQLLFGNYRIVYEITEKQIWAPPVTQKK